MKIHVEWSFEGEIIPALLDEIRDIAGKHGELEERQWFLQANVIDIVTIFQFLGTFSNLNALEGLAGSVAGKDFYSEIREKYRKGAHESTGKFRAFLVDLFEHIISKNRDRYGAFVLVEQIDDSRLFVVLNHKRMSGKLIETLPETIALTAVVMKNIDIKFPPRAIQLYPNFQTDTWDYILMPTARAFGSHMDRFFDLRKRSLEYLESADAFTSRFNPDEEDIFKFIISTERDYDRSKFPP